MSTSVLLASVLVLAGSSTVASGASSSSASKSPIIIGAALGLTGDFATYDGEPLKTAEIAIAKINASGGILGHKIKVVTADTQSVSTNGPTAVKQLLSEGARIILVSCDFDMGSPAAAAAQAAGVVSFSVCAGSDQFGPKGIGPLSYTMGTPAQVEAAAAAQFAWKKGWKTAYTLTDNSTMFQQTYASTFVLAFQHLGGTIEGADTFQASDTSISTQIANFNSLATKPAVVILASQLPEGATAVKELRAAGIAQPIISPIGMDGTSWLSEVPGLTAFYNTSYVSQYGNDPSALVNQVTSLFAKKYGQPPQTAFAYMGYALIQVLQKALTTDGGSTKGKTLAAALNKLTNLPTVVGPTTFTATTHISYSRSVDMMMDSNGTATVVANIKPSYVPGSPG